VKKTLPIESRRIDRLLDVIARMAGGDFATRAPLSARHDALDALAFGLNLLGGELDYTLTGLRKARREAERANAAREVFLRHVTHELRTPLAGILLIVEVLRTPGLEASKRDELVERIERSARALLGLVDQLLDLSKIEADRLDLVLEPVTIEAHVRGVLDAFELEAARKSLRLELDLARDAPTTVRTDATQLRQVLLNVVGNAVKFADSGAVVVRVGREAERDLVTIDVVDTGVGIRKDDRAHLFEPFHRGRANGHRYPGSGLGLALARRLARALGGDVVLAASKPGKGSRFRVTLPGQAAL
jgi:signal transduction histidine kinase